MTAFPYYEDGAMEALNAQADVLLDLFAARGYARAEPSVLQPAALFLDRSGEEIRRRTFTLTDPSGRERGDVVVPPAYNGSAAPGDGGGSPLTFRTRGMQAVCQGCLA